MLPLGEKPLLEHTISALRDAGIRRFHVTTHYLADVIKDHFSDGSHMGVDISYVNEDQPLGTAGALGLLPEVPGPILLLNGDENPDHKWVYFMGMDKVRFRKPVIPGAQLVFELELLRKRATSCKMYGKAFVDGEVVAEAELLAAIVDR